jgi:hypothetical protein
MIIIMMIITIEQNIYSETGSRPISQEIARLL